MVGQDVDVISKHCERWSRHSSVERAARGSPEAKTEGISSRLIVFPKCRHLGAAVFALCVGASEEVSAFELSWQPRVRIGTRVTDNLRTSRVDQEGAWGFDTGGGLIVEAQSDAWRSRITPAFNIRRFAIGEGADAEEYEVRTSSEWAFVERATASLDFDYIRNSTLTTELADTGRQTTVANRDTIYVAPGMSYQLTDRTSMNAGFVYSDVSFQEIPGSPFSDYEFKQGNVGVVHAFDARLSLFANGYVREFVTDAVEGKSLTYGGQSGVTFRYSETLDGDFAVGYTQSEIDFQRRQSDGFQLVVDPLTGQLRIIEAFSLVDANTTENGPIASASIRKRFSESTRSELNYVRSVSPTVFGAQSISDDIQVMIVHRLTNRFSVKFDGRYNMRSTESQELDVQPRNIDRDQVVMSGALRYTVTPEIVVSANYRFVHNELNDLNDSSTNNTLFLNFVYNGEPNFYRGF